jgi:hypothetical protein
LYVVKVVIELGEWMMSQALQLIGRTGMLRGMLC